MAMTRAEIRQFIQGLQQQQPPLSVADLRAAVVDRWLDDRADTLDAGTETQTALAGQHVIRMRKVDPAGRVPYGWSILHPTPDAAAPGGDFKACPFNRVYSTGFVDTNGQPFIPSHRGHFLVSLSADGLHLVIGAEVTP